MRKSEAVYSIFTAKVILFGDGVRFQNNQMYVNGSASLLVKTGSEALVV